MNEHSLTVKEILEKYNVDPDVGRVSHGENSIETGKNALPKAQKKASSLKIFLRQWADPLVLILVISAGVTTALHEYTDTIVIAITVLFNIVVGYIQEKKASNALAALQSMISYSAVVIRDGEQRVIPSENIVEGDVLLLEAGDKIQADGRIISLKEFEVNEAPLTGESEPQKKQAEPVDEQTRLNDRVSMVYRGTTVTKGDAVVIVTGIGADSEIGKIASLVKDTKDESTPLQVQLARLGRRISLLVLVLAACIFFLGIFFRTDISTVEIFKTAVAVAVAAVPGGLVIALTIILAIGMQSILKKKALVRKLVAAETLGSVNIICTDKTGTLTEGVMSVAQLQVGSMKQPVAASGLVDLEQHKEIASMLRAAVLANGAKQNGDADPTSPQYYIGDSTDTAIARFAHAFGLKKHLLVQEYKKTDDIPFDSNRMYMASVNSINGAHVLSIKGAPEKLLQAVTTVREPNGSQTPLTKELHNEIKSWLEEWTGRQLRVLAVAEKKQTDASVPSKPEELELLGFICLQDPIRSDVVETLRTARDAGIRTIMITGDHANTAAAIGVTIGLIEPGESTQDLIITGDEFANMDDDVLGERLDSVRIFARVAPEDKLRIVTGLQKKGAVVAMTGDGVNDSPALKAADIGIALGSGTDVAKEVADLVLLNDKFSTIVAAIGQGRAIYDNIRKVVVYLLGGGFAEVLLVTGSLVASLPIPALPTQILWINIIENLFPTIALTFDPPESENMGEPPRSRNQRIIDKEMMTMIVGKSICANIILFSIFYFVWKATGDIQLTRTVVFVGFGIDALFFIYAVRSFRFMVWERPIFNNKTLTVSILAGWVLLVGAVYIPFLQNLLDTVPLPPGYWVILVSFGVFNLVLIEIIKAIFLKKKFA